jgi:hypothetical protein
MLAKVTHRRQYSSSPPVFFNQESLPVSPSLTVGLLTHPLALGATDIPLALRAFANIESDPFCCSAATLWRRLLAINPLKFRERLEMRNRMSTLRLSVPKIFPAAPHK